MKRIISMACTFMLLGSVMAQTELELKKKELEAAEAQLKAAQTSVETLKKSIEKLTPDPAWKTGGFGALNFNQVGFSNWAAGGQDAISATFLGNAFANYKKDKLSWDNNLDITYGLLKNKGQEFRKNEDKIDLFSKVGHRATEHANWAFLVNYKTQFQPGYDFNNPDEKRPVISRFMAPAFLLASLGIDYKPTDYLSLYISPATGKYTFVMDDSIAAANLYIPATSPNNRFRAEFGALFTGIFQKNVHKNVHIKSKLDLFNNFTDLNEPNRKNMDVNWENNISIKLGKYMGASIITHMIYDNDIDIEYDPENKPGVKGPRLQFKRVFGAGLSYKF
jgi:hypothetical protein